MEKRNELKWAVLGTGGIARTMAQAAAAGGKRLYGAANRTRSRAEAYAEAFGVEKVYDSCEDIFSDPQVDVVYISTPHNSHFPYIVKALESGKHVLSEKAITLNSWELAQAEALAQRKGLVLAEAMTIWHMPLYKRLWEMAEQGELGRVHMITVSFGAPKDYDMSNRFFNRGLGGGALLDLGVYALSFARSFMSSQPDQIASQMRPAPTGVDEQENILLMNREGEAASMAVSLCTELPRTAVISCEKAYIEVPDYTRPVRASIMDVKTKERREIAEGKRELALWYEMQDMETAVLDGNIGLMRNAWTRDVMEIMTQLRKDWGLRYPEEEQPGGR